jgi:flagellar hook-associated protein 1 FlgK
LQARKESISGVNLDEEAAKLLQYQQQYQALARSISISGQLFQSVLNAVR